MAGTPRLVSGFTPGGAGGLTWPTTSRARALATGGGTDAYRRPGTTMGGSGYDEPGGVVVMVAPGGSSNNDAAGEAVYFVISKLLSLDATLT